MCRSPLLEVFLDARCVPGRRGPRPLRRHDGRGRGAVAEMHDLAADRGLDLDHHVGAASTSSSSGAPTSCCPSPGSTSARSWSAAPRPSPAPSRRRSWFAGPVPPAAAGPARSSPRSWPGSTRAHGAGAPAQRSRSTTSPTPSAALGRATSAPPPSSRSSRPLAVAGQPLVTPSGLRPSRTPAPAATDLALSSSPFRRRDDALAHRRRQRAVRAHRPGGRAPEHHAAADRLGELHLAGGDRRPPARCSPTSTPRATRASATTAATQFVDEVEDLARERVKALFGAEHANVQPHSGANANLAVYLALLEPGDKVMGMSLDHGGHLTHGSPVNISGRLYDFVAYGVTPSDERIDYDQIRELARARAPEDDHRRRHRLPPHHRSGAAPRDRRRGRRAVHVRRRPHRRAHRRRRAPQPGALRRHRHLHHPQDPARPARRLHPQPPPSSARPSTRRCSRACRAARSST